MKIINKITPIEKDFAQWYVDVIINGNLIDYGPLKGTMILKSNSYGIWENITKHFDQIIKKLGVKNVYLPLLIPKSLISKEKEHVEGFAPELATITKVGDKKLSEDIYIRPTSEVLFAQLFKSEISSYNDLPKKYNQWANVVRWEKTTNPFLRTTEFLWQEGHTSHSNPQEAMDLSKKMIQVYKDFYKDYLALDVIVGQKTEKEKFAGAITTWTIEAMMKDGKALQSATSHYFGQNFSSMFDVSFKDQNNKLVNVYQTSWGLSTRSIGAIIMGHGDNRGIVIPPKIAPIQVDIIEVLSNKDSRVSKISKELMNILDSNLITVRINDSDKSVGFKAAQSEIEGVPIRIEVGPRDLDNDEVVIIRRDTIEKTNVKINNVLEEVKRLLSDIHDNLYKNSQERLRNNIVYCNSYDKFKELIKENKFIIVPLAKESTKLEEKIKNETLATARCIPIDKIIDIKDDNCIITNQKTDNFVLFAKAY
ncbi:MAG: proline--tRNA ligase [Mycoplasma sp.]|nr:proline--tRNA ligase [Mycoplasma sp.]